MKNLCISILLLLAGLNATAQEFWMEPDSYTHKPGDSLKVRFMVGDNFAGERWNLRQDRVQKATLYRGAKVTEIKGQLKEGKTDHLKMPLKEEGGYVFVMQGNNAFMEMDATRFNAYLKEHGLDDAINSRKKNNAENSPGKEFYQRNTKLILQVGARRDEFYKKIAGLPLELIPEQNPVTYKVGDEVSVKVLFEGKPLFGARAFAWNMKDNHVYSQPIYTLQDGTIKVRLFNNGPWMITIIKMVPSKESGADWQSYWGSLVFNVN